MNLKQQSEWKEIRKVGRRRYLLNKMTSMLMTVVCGSLFGYWLQSDRLDLGQFITQYGLSMFIVLFFGGFAIDRYWHVRERRYNYREAGDD
ncbi:hypothetical protein [Vibrio sp. SCSIO 43136]|uniref:hypothetical protein n=1 Tax=Vibrio sp. SCSIO 43136 TaxID=2819101 RepID=UPI0020762874|nr:hypothetical protein [Vibrio sp. SCSIO 43136]USD67321.1 hypothetical protein J4N39_22075 [Vibrio sp. SCSIO 43136]